jgi:hypothetical protein
MILPTLKSIFNSVCDNFDYSSNIFRHECALFFNTVSPCDCMCVNRFAIGIKHLLFLLPQQSQCTSPISLHGFRCSISINPYLMHLMSFHQGSGIRNYCAYSLAVRL